MKLKITLFMVLMFIFYMNLPYVLPHKDPPSVTKNIKIPQIIDSTSVIKTLQSASEIVGLSGSSVKQYSYQDRTIFGTRSYTYNSNIHYKLGYDVQELIMNLSIDNNSIIITQPKIQLISLDMPLDEIEINEDVGWLRSDLTIAEQQVIYKSMRDKAYEELIHNDNVIKTAKLMTNKTVEDLIKTIPNVERVVWKND